MPGPRGDTERWNQFQGGIETEDWTQGRETVYTVTYLIKSCSPAKSRIRASHNWSSGGPGVSVCVCMCETHSLIFYQRFR